MLGVVLLFHRSHVLGIVCHNRGHETAPLPRLLVAGSLKLTVIAGLLEELPRDFITPVQTQSCVQPATYRKPKGVHYSVKPNRHISQQIEFDV